MKNLDNNIFKKIKICGLKDKKNLLECLQLNPALVGHIFYEDSPRYISFKDYQSLAKVDYQETKKVAVVVNPSIELVANLFQEYDFKIFQIHQLVDKSFFAKIKKLSKEIVLIQALAIKDLNSFKNLNTDGVDYFLFDCYGKNPGGNGQSFNWELLDAYKEEIPYVLSGGINPQNFGQAWQALEDQKKCHYLDINSGYELQPGLKDLSLLKNIFSNENE